MTLKLSPLRDFEVALWFALCVGCAVVLVLLWPRPEVARSVRCADFRTQPSAQARFESNPVAYAHLDADYDRRACESLPSR